MTFSLTFTHLRGNFTSWGEDTSLPHPYVIFRAGGQKTQTKVRSGQHFLPRKPLFARRKQQIHDCLVLAFAKQAGSVVSGVGGGIRSPKAKPRPVCAHWQSYNGRSFFRYSLHDPLAAFWSSVPHLCARALVEQGGDPQ